RPISYVVISMAALALLASPSMPVERIVASLKRLPDVAPIEAKIEVKPRQADVEVPASFRASELQSFTITSDQDVAVNVEAKKGFVEPLILVQGVEPCSWAPGSSTPSEFEGDVSTLYITNESDSPANVSIQMYTDVETPQVRAIPIA